MTRILAIALLLFSVGCKKKAPEPAEPMVTRDTKTEVPTAPEGEVPAAVQQMRANFERVYFELDSHELSEDAKQALSDNVAIMQENTDIKVEIQGHADERGTTDYNLALGQKRAEAVRNHMVRVGVAQTRVTAVSFGEERPAVSASNEAAWSKNRRAEFRITWGQGIGGTVE